MIFRKRVSINAGKHGTTVASIGLNEKYDKKHEIKLLDLKNLKDEKFEIWNQGIIKIPCNKKDSEQEKYKKSNLPLKPQNTVNQPITNSNEEFTNRNKDNKASVPRNPKQNSRSKDEKTTLDNTLQKEKKEIRRVLKNPNPWEGNEREQEIKTLNPNQCLS